MSEPNVHLNPILVTSCTGDCMYIFIILVCGDVSKLLSRLLLPPDTGTIGELCTEFYYLIFP